ncbi:uncharacterized protein FPRO_13700 [Fusarium proliferatum ET1]|uniref:Zn(2)-C6 fungal-type domain-containing protein n=1 Tax=Fusarium proliferatum (strain ET1) TaxID=1227346 RepID=A0A1L7VU22_FUSPR|nr:uncharacterized protein FPRO_13700 [Fusarium proliferatum ET1]CZR43892.1 uncharacterized protein FPRO_13700 [Fusarium proliferatum ET1]
MTSFTATSRPKSSRRSKYTAVACLECQRRKNKCSGENECEPCRRRGVRCVYSTNGRHRIRRRQCDEVRNFMNLASRSSTSASPPSSRSMTLSQPNYQSRNTAVENEIESVDANSISHDSLDAPQIMPIPALNSEPRLAEERIRRLETTLQTIAKLSSRSVANPVDSW